MKRNLSLVNNLKYVFIVFSIILGSCASHRNLVYFSDLQNKSVTPQKNISQLLNESEPRIQKNDLLDIRVTTLSAESNALFNAGNPVTSSSTDVQKNGYRVDNAGNIDFPVVGTLKLSGLTLDEAKEKLSKALSAFTKNPVINIDFLNFKVTVIGEVNRPGTFTVPDDNITLLTALGLAGDMTAYGKRENVLVIRQVNGIRSMDRINLNNSELFDSKYYYLKQNDVVYVEPDKSKTLTTDQSNRFIPIIAASMSVVAVLLSIYLKR